MNRRLYALHRWVSLVALLQLLVWTATGLFFAIVPIQRIRGEDRTAKAEPAPIPWDRVGALPAAALAGAEEVQLRVVDGRPLLLARGERGARRWAVDAATGEPHAFDAAAAERLARADQTGGPAALRVERVEEAEGEYRGRPVPAWRVDLDDGRGTRVYVDAATGAVTARRNGLWRVYDFLWGLHIMDWREREDFNHAWLVAFAVLGLATVVTGSVVWVARAVRKAGPGRPRAGAAA